VRVRLGLEVKVRIALREEHLECEQNLGIVEEILDIRRYLCISNRRSFSHPIYGHLYTNMGSSCYKGRF
jgi:hypothetical protein